MSTHDYKQETTFYEELQNRTDIDLRDNRGKRHNLAFILPGLAIGLLRKRDGQLSSIHRSMVNMNVTLNKILILRISYLNNQRMKMKVEKAIEFARNNKSLKGIIIEDLTDTQVKAVDALILAEISKNKNF
ncbi:MAG: hypothetical protein R2828_13880 [Saprospiraceae bacterium]